MLAPYTARALLLLHWRRLLTIYNVAALRYQVQGPCLQAKLESDHHRNAVTEHLAAYYGESI